MHFWPVGDLLGHERCQQVQPPSTITDYFEAASYAGMLDILKSFHNNVLANNS